MLVSVVMAVGGFIVVAATPVQADAFICTDLGCPADTPPSDTGVNTGCPEDNGVATEIAQTWADFFGADVFPFERYPELDPPVVCHPLVYNPPPGQHGAQVVAFGDSYMSGEGLPPGDLTLNGPTPSFDTINDPCDLGINKAWPAPIFLGGYDGNSSGGKSMFENDACSGAHADGNSNPGLSISAQIDQAQKRGLTGWNPAAIPSGTWLGVGRDTSEVLIDGGGNDLGFGPGVGCAVKDPHQGITYRSVDQQGVHCIPDTNVLQPKLTALQPHLVALYEKAGNAAFNALIDVVGYPELFPEPTTLHKCPASITVADQEQIDKDTIDLNKTIVAAVKQAQAGGYPVRFADMTTALLKAGPCITRNSHVRGLNVLKDNSGGPLGFYHPNEFGQAAMTGAFARARNGHFFDGNSLIAPVAPADGSLIFDPAADSVDVAAGGALLPFANSADLRGAGYANTPITPTQPLQIAQMRTAQPMPADGTLLRDAPTGGVYKIVGGTKTPVTTGSVTGAVTVSQFTLNEFPDASTSSGATSPGTIFDPITQRTEVYYNSGGTLTQAYRDNTTGNFTNFTLGASITGQPSVIYDSADGYLEVYYNSGGKLAATVYMPGKGWVSVGVIGAAITGSPTAIFDNWDGNIEIYYNSNGHLHESAYIPFQSQALMDEGDIGGAITGTPSVLLDPASGNLEFYYNSGGTLTETAYVFDTGFVQLGAIGGAITGSPHALFSPHSGGLEVYYNSSGSLARTTWTHDTGFVQSSPGGTISGDPTPTLDPATGNIDIYYNSNGQLARNILQLDDASFNDGTFTGQTVIGGPMTNDPAVMYDPVPQVMEVYLNSGGTLAQDAFNPSNTDTTGIHPIGGAIS